MYRAQKRIPGSGTALLLCVLLTAVVVKQGFLQSPGWYWGLAITLPALLAVVLLRKRSHRL